MEKRCTCCFVYQNNDDVVYVVTQSANGSLLNLDIPS